MWGPTTPHSGFGSHYTTLRVWVPLHHTQGLGPTTPHSGCGVPLHHTQGLGPTTPHSGCGVPLHHTQGVGPTTPHSGCGSHYTALRVWVSVHHKQRMILHKNAGVVLLFSAASTERFDLSCTISQTNSKLKSQRDTLPPPNRILRLTQLRWKLKSIEFYSCQRQSVSRLRIESRRRVKCETALVVKN